MAQERGSARVSVTAVVMMVAMAMVLHCGRAKTYTVGDGQNGWTTNVNKSKWAKANLQGKTSFKAGDILVFKYTNIHNLVEVSKKGYDSCTTAGQKFSKTSGNDKITLSKGPHYYICSKPGHCTSGMKIAVTAN
ncbi:hypothetical protein OROMI_033399 [Orobanche minor]